MFGDTAWGLIPGMLLVSSSAKKDARATALRYLAQIPADHLPCALRINSPETKFGLNDLQDLLNSPAEPDYLVLPKCNSAALIRLVGNLLREAKKATQIIGLIESAKAIEALEEIVDGEIKPAALVFGAADMAGDLGTDTAWEPLLYVRSRIIRVTARAGIAAIDSPYFEIRGTPDSPTFSFRASVSLYLYKRGHSPEQAANY
jgi:(S)-citramalyl-CoA lyase